MEAKRLSGRAASAEEIDDGAGGWEGVALGRREADIECGFELVTELDQVEGVAPLIGHRLRRLGFASGDIPRSPTKAASRPTFDGGRLKCRATTALTRVSIDVVICRQV